MSPIDLVIIVGYILGVTLFGAAVGTRSKGLKGYFLGGSAVPTWAVMISIVATETSTATFLSVPSLSYREGGDFTYLQLAIGYILGRIVVVDRPAAELFPRPDVHGLSGAQRAVRRRDARRRPRLLFLVSRTLGDGLRLFLAAMVLRDLMLLSGIVGDGPDAWIMPARAMPAAIVVMGVSTIVYTYLGGMTAVDLDRRHPVRHLHDRRHLRPC